VGGVSFEKIHAFNITDVGHTDKDLCSYCDKHSMYMLSIRYIKASNYLSIYVLHLFCKENYIVYLFVFL
jgi:hypothetical protein